MQDIEQLTRDFDSVEGWQKHVGGLMKGGKAKKSFAIWQKADTKFVAPLYQVRKDKSDVAKYQIVAWADRDVNVGDLENLGAQIPLGTMRMEASTISPYLYKYFGDQLEVNKIFQSQLGAFAKVIANQKNYSAVAYAKVGDKDYAFYIK